MTAAITVTWQAEGNWQRGQAGGHAQPALARHEQVDISEQEALVQSMGSSGTTAMALMYVGSDGVEALGNKAGACGRQLPRHKV